MARAGEEGHEEHNALRRQKPPPPQAFFRLYDEEDAEGWVRPGVLAEPRPQERHKVEHIVLRALCSHGAKSRCTCAADGGTSCRTSCISSARSHLILNRLFEVPMILPDDVPMRTAVRDTQLAEQRAEVFKVLSQYRIQQQMWSRSLIFQLVEVLKVFARARVPHLVDFFTMRVREIKGFFRTFPQHQKSVEVLRQSSARVPAGSALIKWLLLRSLMRVERMGLAMPCPLRARLCGGCGGGERVEERAEAEAAGGALVLPVLFSDQFLQSKEFDQNAPQIQFIF